MWKKIAIGSGILVILLAIAGNYLWSNLDSIIKTAVNKYGSEATQTTVHLGSVKMSLASGEGSLGDLSVGSPKGFSADKALYLGTISVKLDTKSVTGTGPIVIKQIVIDKPQITYEVTASGDSNLQTIAHNAQNYANSFGAEKKAAEPKQDDKTPSTEKAPGRKIIIESLEITNGQIAITQPLLKDKQLAAALPSIHLNNIGKSKGGASPAEVAEVLLGVITQSASQVATASLTKELGGFKKLGDGAMGAATGAIGGAKGQVKSLFGR